MSFGNPFSQNYETESGALALGFNGFEVSLNYVSGLPDPNIVANSSLKLIFKSLLKRDDLTKEKGLGELVTFIGNSDNLSELKDDLVLITWTQLYPKLSLSESKSVRSLSHQVQTLFISALQKSFAKYLKDSIPVLLTGLYDFDSSVSNSTLKNLNKVFSNDQTKVNNVWVIFQNEILNFADQSLNKETVDSLSDDRYVPRDEAELKYLRLINATISIVSHLIQVGTKLFPDKIEKSIEKYQDFFLYENLWHYLLVNSNSNSQRIFKTLLSLITAVTKIKPDFLTEKAWKLLSKRFLKSLTFASKLDKTSPNAVVYSSLAIPIISTLNVLNEANPSFYAYDKNHKDKIVGFFTVGSLNSDASYYNLLSKFITSSSIFDFGNQSDITLVEKILHDDFQTEVSKNLKFRAGTPFIVNSLNTYFEIVSKVDGSKTSEIVDEALEIKAPVTSQFVNIFAKYLDDSILNDKLLEYSTTDNSNISVLLKVAAKKSTKLDQVLSTSLDSLREKADEDENGKTFENHNAFQLFDFIIKENLSDYTTEVEEFLDDLPSFITPLTIDQPVSILVNYSKSTLYNKELFIETFDNFLIKLTFLDSKDRLLSKLDAFKNKDELIFNSEELKAAINEVSSNVNFSDDALFKTHLITKESAVDLFGSAKSQDKIASFIDHYWKHNSKNLELLTYVIKNTTILTDSLWSTPLNVDILSAVEKLLQEDEDIRKVYFQSLKEFALKTDSDEISKHVGEFLRANTSLINYLIDDESTEKLLTAYGGNIDSRLSLGNPLESNVYLLSTEENSFQFEALLPIIKLGLFLSTLDLEFSDDLLLYLGILSEISVDYEFLVSKSKLSNDKVVSFHAKINAILTSRFSSESLNSIISQIIAQSNNIEFMKRLTTESNQVLSFYKSRLLKQILNSKEPTSIAELDLDKFVRSELRSKDITSLLTFTTVISSIRDFLSNDKYERTRNLVGSELIGLKPSEILSNGLIKLSIFINFVGSNESNNDYIPLQAQRFNMIINDLNKWLDSDIAYEPEFHTVRVQLLQFLTLLNGLKFEKNDNFKELTLRVLQDSTGLISIGEGDGLLELKYHSLKLFLVLERNAEFKNDLRDVQTEILESFINDENNDTSQASIVYNELLNRLLSKIPVTKFNEHFDTLLEKYEKLENLQLKRSLLTILSKLILSKQQDLVIEFELNKSEDLEPFKINKRFIESVLRVPEFIDDEYENDVKLIKYLWDWSLVLQHFKDITLKLRATYIQQLQSDNDSLITKFLNFLSVLVVDIDDKELLAQLDESNELVQEYNFINDTDDLFKEIRALSIHLYYTILTSIGSLSSSWFHDIKDRGFKSKLEAFTQKYISPSLIQDKISKFEAKSSQFTKDENLSLKFNRITNEIKTSYLIDEQTLEVVFRIPSNYPLSNIEVSGPQRIGVKENQWRGWILASQSIISLQNGEIAESLEFFMKNVSFHFKGFEECAICYSILHQDNSLPSKTCTTCKNKFHAGCLYKWFKSSGGNTCPLCRSTFNFR